MRTDQNDTRLGDLWREARRKRHMAQDAWAAACAKNAGTEPETKIQTRPPRVRDIRRCEPGARTTTGI